MGKSSPTVYRSFGELVAAQQTPAQESAVKADGAPQSEKPAPRIAEPSQKRPRESRPEREIKFNALAIGAIIDRLRRHKHEAVIDERTGDYRFQVAYTNKELNDPERLDAEFKHPGEKIWRAFATQMTNEGVLESRLDRITHTQKEDVSITWLVLSADEMHRLEGYHAPRLPRENVGNRR